MNINELGWNSFFEKHFGDSKRGDFIPARIACQHKGRYDIHCSHGSMTAEISGKLQHESVFMAEYPAVGDWVVVTARPHEGKAIIHKILPRKSSFSRKAILAGGRKGIGGETEEQILAANIDTVFLVSGLDRDFNIRRIERYVAIAWDSGANPVVILNKADVCRNLEEPIEEVETVAMGVPVHAVSAIEKTGLDALQQYLARGSTVVFLGSSGVGKSTIINSLLGDDLLKVGGLRVRDQRGRHTTTQREMIILPSGGIVIDTPGMREIQLWSDDEGLSRTFADVEEIADQCRFRNCRHQGEPGCAVEQALEDGTLDRDRFDSYGRLQKELKYLSIRKDQKARLVETAKWKKITKSMRQRYKMRGEK
ncbi:MAG: ribosome small subunit-dependent GTPase A [Candidatus Zixiibacteriota bacterium]